MDRVIVCDTGYKECPTSRLVSVWISAGWYLGEYIAGYDDENSWRVM